jgi:hypothetical protein
LVDVVSKEDFVTPEEAADRLGLRVVPWINMMRMTRVLTPAATTPPPWYQDDHGFTRESVEREEDWWSAASPAEKRRRKRSLMLKAAGRSF